MLRKIARFFKHYPKFGLVVIAALASLGLDLGGADTLAHWFLGSTAILLVIPLLWDMIESLRSGEYGIDILAATAIITSVILHEYWAAIIIVIMLTGGEALEDYAEQRAKGELTALLNNKPKKAHLIKGNKTTDIKASAIKIGDKLRILPGETVPVDCEIIEGSSSFDESSLTGESLPVSKNTGETVLSGSINVEGAITVKAVRIAADSQYEQIIKLVKSAASSQSPFVRLADRYSIPFTIVAYIIAGSVWFISGDPERFLEVLVVATPCPLLLGAPIALISGMSRAAKHGIIVKNGSTMERLAEIQTVAFDKTGTLTMGIPTINKVFAYNKFKADEVLTYAAALEQSSNHILSRSIISAAQDKKLKLNPAKQVKEISGRGLSGRLSGKTVLVGRLSLLQDENITFPKEFKSSDIKQTATYVAVDGVLVGAITFTDEIRSEAKGMLARLRKLGIKNTLMVTGDNAITAHAIAKQLDISEVKADCLPADKIIAIDAEEKKPIAFVGDGVNDAPVLMAADVGIALGARGSTAASESADVVIMHDNVAKVATSIEIAKRTFSIARQSILGGIFLSLILMGFFATGKFKPVQGAIIQELVDVLVIINALRAHRDQKLQASE